MTYSTELIRDGLHSTYGNAITKANIEAWIADSGVSLSYQTVAKKLKQYKSGRGTYNLEVTKETVKDLEVSYNSPAAIPSVEQNLIPRKMIPSSSLVTSLILKKLFLPSILPNVHYGPFG